MREDEATPNREGRMPIGMFSRASLISVKTLRAYHESGLLVPAHVDGATGYRTYGADQLADAAVIVRLRGLDLPLAQVHEVLRARDPEVTAKILHDHHVAMERRLNETERIVAELQSSHTPAAHTPVHLRDEPAQLSLSVSGEVPAVEFASWLGNAYGMLSDALVRTGAVAAGPQGALYGAEALDEAEQVEAFVPIAAAVAVPRVVSGVRLSEVPAARCAVLVHVGGYDTIADTYRTLGAWVAANAVHASERVREWYVVGPPDSDDPAEYRTEIAWPVRTKDGRNHYQGAQP